MRDLSSSISRLGESADLYYRVEGFENEFGQATETWVPYETVLTVRDPSDGLMFYFLPSDTPAKADRMEYNDLYFEFDRIKEYESHTAAEASLLEDWSP